MNSSKLALHLCALLLGVWVPHGYAVDHSLVQEELKSECIGHYVAALPGEVELALTDFSKDGNIINFADGVGAPYAWLGGMAISRAISLEDFNRYEAKLTQNRDRNNEKYRASGQADWVLEPLTLEIPHAFASRNRNNASLHLYRGGHQFWRRFQDVERLEAFIRAFRPRSLYEIPTDPGQCIPYGFIAESGQQGRIAVTMRLKDHPDVAIHFGEIQTEGKPCDDCREPTSKDEILFFWESDYARRSHRTTLQGIPRFRKVYIAGREGLETFVEILRSDNPKNPRYDDRDDSNNDVDYGYLAYARGDRNAPTDTPDLMVYVIRTARESQGKAPVTREELKAMAEAVVASIRRRP